MSRAKFALALVSSISLGGGALVVGANASSSAKPALTFSHEVVVDEQRAGFEPDIAIDNAGRIYSTIPNGSSEAHSFIWQSLDHGKSFQMIPGQLGLGKPATCPQGGGDTETQIDKKGDIFFSDLQNLSNLSNSVSTNQGATWTTNCLSVPNSPVDRMWYAIHGNLGDPDFAIYEEYDAAASGTNPTDPNAPTNQLVESVSHDGITFTPVFNGSLVDGKVDNNCLGGGQLNCVTDNEGISGNQVLARNGDLLIAHTTEDSNQVVVSRGKLTMEPGGQVVAHWTHTVVNGSLCPDKGSNGEICGASNFATIAEDSAGHFYVAFSSQKTNKSGNPIGPYETYVVSSKDGNHWGKPMLVSKSGSNAFSWVNAGSSGRVAVAWYHADETNEKGHYLLDDLTHAEISVQVGESLDALSSHPHWTVSTVSEHPIKYGPICTQGLDCTISMGDRSLGDFLEVNHDAQGALVLSYVDDTSNTYSTGPTGAVAENGPAVVVRQTGGPSLIAGTIHGAGTGPGAPYDSVTDATGDDVYSANTMRTPAGPALDLTAARIREDKDGLVVTMTTRSPTNVLPAPTTGGEVTEWITRFTTYDPHTPGNGHIYYAGMESTGGATPRFFGGDVAPTPGIGEEISMLFDSNTTVPGAVQGNTITLHVPWSMIGGNKRGRVLYSATAFTATAPATLAKNPAGLFNLTDATAPFDYVVKK